MKNKSFLLLLVLCLPSTKFYAQQQSAPVTISYQKNNTNDTVWLTVNNTPDTKPGTLMLVATSSLQSKPDTSYYPVLDTSLIILAIPQVYQSGTIHLHALFYPEIFEVTGKVLSRVKNRSVNAMLITDDSKHIYNKPLTLIDENHFALPGFVFVNKATLIFSYTSDNDKKHPDVSIEQTPSAKDFTNIVFDQTIALSSPVIIKDSSSPKAPVADKGIPSKDSTDKFKLLNTVTVKGQRKSRAEKFNEEYSTALFNEIDERVIDVMDNPQAQAFPDCLSFLRSQIAGLTVSTDKFGDNYISWRGHETKAFFIDEIPVDIDELLSINVADIAIIKAYPPPYSGGLGTGDGGGIAIYTRRGEYRNPNSPDDNKWLYSIKGYAAPNHILFSGN
jgi:hypothetical protein